MEAEGAIRRPTLISFLVATVGIKKEDRYFQVAEDFASPAVSVHLYCFLLF